MNYTVLDYPAFFHDIGFPQGLAMMERVKRVMLRVWRKAQAVVR